MKKSIEGCSHVIHLGEIVGDPAVAHNEKLSIQNNYEATNTVINECIKNNIKNLYLLQVVVFMVSQKKFVTKNQNLIQCLYTQSAKWHANSNSFT